MIGILPVSLEIDGVIYPINSDFRDALDIFQAYNAKELSQLNKQLTMLEVIYGDNIPENREEAIKQAVIFLDVKSSPAGGMGKEQLKTLDWEQDEQLLFAAVNAVTGYDVRECEYMHWWTFYGYCQSISPDALISHIVHIRHKRGSGEKMDKQEQKFYYENRHLIDMQSSADSYDDMMRQLRGE